MIKYSFTRPIRTDNNIGKKVDKVITKSGLQIFSEVIKLSTSLLIAEIIILLNKLNNHINSNETQELK